MKLKRVLAFLVLMSIVFLPLNIYGVDDIEEYIEEDPRSIIENYELEKNNDGDNTYTIVSYSGSTYTNIIPGEIDGKIITRIGDGAFKNIDRMAGQVTLPDTITYIGDEAFYGNTKLIRVRFGRDLEEIGDSAFENCRGLQGTYMQIPESVEYIGSNAFASAGIDLIIFNSENAPTITANTFYRCLGLKIRVPNRSEGYTQENNWPSDKVIATLLGDANGDGAVNSVDAATVIDKYKKNEFTNDDLYIVDMNYDKTINSVDAAIIIDNYKKNI